MKRLIALAIFATVFSLTGTKSIHAQSLTPEFSLPLRLTDPTPTEQTRRAFGYDARATTGQDTAFGEQPDVPGGGGMGMTNYYFLYPTSSPFEVPNATWVDILPKPTIDSFDLEFPIDIYVGTFPGTLHWDHTLIPEKVKGIWITPRSDPGTMLVDMTQQDSLIITSEMDLASGSSYLIRLFYNMTPTKLGVDAPQHFAALQSASIYPNPFSSTSMLRFEASTPGPASISVFDFSGKKIGSTELRANVGENELNIQDLMQNRGEYLVRILLTTDGATAQRTILVTKQ